MKSKILLFISLLWAYCLSSQTIIPGGDVSGVWTPEASPYLIQGNINIPVDSSLTIMAGTEIEFQGYFSLQILGRIYATGNENQYIYINAQDTSTGWAGLRFYNQVHSPQDSSILKYCIISHAKNLNKSGQGGGIYCYNSAYLILEYLEIYRCTADSGAGIFLQNSPISFRNSTINQCFADRAGGMFIHSSSPKVNKLAIINNTGNVCGGLNLYKSDGSYRNMFIAFNHSNGGGGGLIINKDCQPVFTNTEIIENTAKGSGGGIAVLQSSEPVFSYCEIRKNECIKEFYETLGAGVFITRFDNFPQFKNCIIDDNTCAGNGGGIYTGDELNLLNCRITDNTANTEEGIGGGGIYTAEGSVLIMNSTISENTSIKGKSIYSNGSTVAMYNSIVWNNTSILQNHIYLSGLILPSYFYANFNDIQDGELSVDAEGTYELSYGPENIDQDPGFESIGWDYNLTENSACINKGTLDTLGFFIQPLDLNHNARVVHDSIDMGAYEQQGGVWITESRVQSPECRIWPNPFRDMVNVELINQAGKGIITVLSLTGEIILKQQILYGKKIYLIDLQAHQDGIYLLQIKTNSSIYSRRIIKL